MKNKTTYERPEICSYGMDADYLMVEYSVPKGEEGTDEQLSKKNFFDGQFEEESNESK
jgi:hypothetical protein